MRLDFLKDYATAPLVTAGIVFNRNRPNGERARVELAARDAFCAENGHDPVEAKWWDGEQDRWGFVCTTCGSEVEAP